jgi:hypothetical protein
MLEKEKMKKDEIRPGVVYVFGKRCKHWWLRKG